MSQVFHLSARLHLPSDEAFAYFTDKQRLESWLTAEAEVEPVVGGSYQLFWQPQDRENNSTIGCRITALEPGQLIAFDWKSPRQFKEFANSADPLTHVTVAFTSDGDFTVVHLVHSGWRSTAEWQEARQWQETAWRGALTHLARRVNGE